MNKIAFLGLGVMGAPMAGHLNTSENTDLKVWSRSQTSINNWSKRFNNKQSVGYSLVEAVANRDFVFMCLGKDEDVLSVVKGGNGKQGILSTMKKGSILIDHTTTSAKLAKHLEAECLKLDIGFIDAPVSGGQGGAENGTLTIMCGGSDETYNVVLKLLSIYARKVLRMGEAGSGQLTKMVNQICIAGVLQSLSEAIKFGEMAGLDISRVISAISQGAAQSWQMDNRAETMSKRKFDYGFAVKWMLKDLLYAQEEAEKLKAKIPITKTIYDNYKLLAQDDNQDSDTSSLILLLDKKN